MKPLSQDFLNEATYGGLVTNPLSSSCFYCYLIHDREYNMYYSGVKTNHVNSNHGLLVDYFTTSSVVDFKERLKKNPDRFSFKVEYFESKESAFAAEKEFHELYDVARRTDFYNAINSCGSMCGAGSVLCIDDRGSTYRVSINEYRSGNHRHVSTGKMNVYNEEGSLIKIKVSDYDVSKHRKELDGVVHVLHIPSGKSVRIASEEYKSNPEIYCGVTKGMVSAFDTSKEQYVSVSLNDFSNNKELIGVTHGKVSVKEKESGRWALVDKDTYRSNKVRYDHPNTGFVVLYDKVDERMIRVTIDEYTENKNRYENQVFHGGYKCYERDTGHEVRIPYEVFDANRDRYIGHKTRLVVCRNLKTGSTETVPIEVFDESDHLVGVSKGTVTVFNLKTGLKLTTTPDVLNATPYFVSANTPKIYLIDSIVFKNHRGLKKYLKVTYNSELRMNDSLSKFEPTFLECGGKYIFKNDYNKGLKGVNYRK